MEKLADRYEDLTRALKRFDEIIRRFEDAKKNKDADEQLIFRDSLIKRFEFCYDLLWKSLKDVLIRDYGIDTASPKKALYECYSQKLISESQLKEALEMVDDRNNTTHTYSDEIAELVSQKIKAHLALMQKLYSLIKI